MTEPDFQDFDLLGDPIPKRFGGKGRPPHVANREKAITIMLLAAVGKNKKEIAKAIGVTQPTLNKHYFSAQSEYRIKAGECRERVTAKLLLKLFHSAEEGNVAANKALWDRLDAAELEALDAKISAPAKGDKPEKPAKPLGKKEQLQADAAEIGGLYAPPVASGQRPN